DVCVNAHRRSVYQVPTILEQPRTEKHPDNPVRPPPARTVPRRQEHPRLSIVHIYLDECLGTALPVAASENEDPVRRVDDLQLSADFRPSESRLAVPRGAPSWSGVRDVDRPLR